MKKERLSALAWIEAAFRALTKGGPQAIKVEVIARDLAVSKGSFYWHFENAQALKSQMLEHWKNAATEAIISQLEGDDLSAEDKLRLLIEISTSDVSAPYGGKGAEAAIRDWGRYDRTVSELVAEVDRQRLAYLSGLFEQLDDNNAVAHSEILYAGLIGLEMLEYQALADSAQRLPELLEQLLLMVAANNNI